MQGHDEATRRNAPTAELEAFVPRASMNGTYLWIELAQWTFIVCEVAGIEYLDTSVMLAIEGRCA